MTTSWSATTGIAAMELDGVKAPLEFSGATDTRAFQAYVDRVLASELKPGDVVVFGNLKAHLAPGVEESIKDAKASVLRLPPYGSDYNPIEELWSKFKGKLRAIGTRTKERLDQAVGDALDQVTVKDIPGWFNRSGVHATRS